MQLMREQLKTIFPKINDAHAGLLLQRGLIDWETDAEKKALRAEKKTTEKEKLIETITSVKPNDLYLLAFNRWLDATHEDGNANFATVTAKVNLRLFSGLSTGGTLETGATTHHTYGMPILPGSSIKGAVRSYTEHLFAERDENDTLKFEKSGNTNKIIIQKNYQQVLDILFGTDSYDDSQEDAGYLIWHDAWWIPWVDEEGTLLTGENYKPFVGDVVTVHHPEYYKPNSLVEALDMESPMPNQQIAIQGAFYFVIEGEQKWVYFAKELLKETITSAGLGSKGSSGYGYFVLGDTLSNDIAKRYGKGVAIDTSNDPLAAIRHEIKYLDENQLIENLSKKGRTNFFKKLNKDKSVENDCKDVVQVVLEEHSQAVATWAEVDAIRTKQAYNFIDAKSISIWTPILL